MARTLILFAHPTFEKSRVHRQLIRHLPDRADITFHDLYERYPDYQVDVAQEQALLLEHETIILQHPLFWYSIPPLLKQWIDLVLEHGWAYGSSGTALQGKRLFCLLSAGGSASAYGPDGHNRFTIREFLRPVEQTARLCGFTYWPPYIIHGTHRLSSGDIEIESRRYSALLGMVADDRVSDGDVVDAEDLNTPLAGKIRSEVSS